MTSQSRIPGGFTIPPGVVPSLSKEDLYSLLWKRAEDKDTDKYFNDVKIKDPVTDHLILMNLV